MATQDIIIFEPATSEEANALKAFAKALKLKFQVSKTKINESKKEILDNIQQGFREVKLMEEGKIKTTSAKDFLNEL